MSVDPPGPAPAAVAVEHHEEPHRPWWILIVVAVVAVAIGAFVWYRVTHPAVVAPRYLSERVMRGDLDETIRATGTVQPVLQVQVGAQVSGRVIRVAVDFNSLVRRGDLLAEIDATTYLAQVAQVRATLRVARATLAQNRANLVLAQQNLARVSALRARGLNAAVDLEQATAQRDAARATVQLADAQIAQAQASLQNAQTNLSYTRIYAPIDGTVATRSVDPGQTVAASFQTPTMFLIANDLTHMRVMADVDEANIGKLREGMGAVARVDAFPRAVFRGTVSALRITPTSTNGVVTYATVIGVDNPDRMLRPGMTATITVNTQHRVAVLTVPNAALRYRPAAPAASDAGVQRPRAAPVEAAASADQGAIYVLRGGVAARVPVVIGITNGTRTEVTAAALQERDVVVLDETDASGNRLSGAPRMRMF